MGRKPIKFLSQKLSYCTGMKPKVLWTLCPRVQSASSSLVSLIHAELRVLPQLRLNLFPDVVCSDNQIRLKAPANTNRSRIPVAFTTTIIHFCTVSNKNQCVLRPSRRPLRSHGNRPCDTNRSGVEAATLDDAILLGNTVRSARDAIFARHCAPVVP